MKNLCEREFFLYQILDGIVNIRIKKLRLQIRKPDFSIKRKSVQVYLNTLKKCQKEGIQDSNKFDREKELTKLVDKIENLKVLFYESFFKDSKDKVKKQIETAKKEFDDLYYLKHRYDYMTGEGVAGYSRFLYIIMNCTFSLQKRYSFTDVSPERVLNLYQSKMISDEVIRELARTSPWDGIWSAAREAVFDLKNLSIEQQRLLSWSKFYDNIHENHDSPDSEIIEDDDALDGWLLLCKRKREIDKRRRKIEKELGVKQGDTMLVVDNQAEANKIYELNDANTRRTVQSRFKQLEQKGVMRETDFADVRQTIQMALAGK